MGLYTGATLHEVAHVVGAGNAMGAEIADGAVIVKMIRVMMLAPVLVVMGFVLGRRKSSGACREKSKIAVPWFAFGFIGIICLNSLLQYLFGVESVREIPLNGAIEYADTFLLTMAMTALGTETSIDKFRQAGVKPFVLAGLLYVWLFRHQISGWNLVNRSARSLRFTVISAAWGLRAPNSRAPSPVRSPRNRGLRRMSGGRDSSSGSADGA